MPTIKFVDLLKEEGDGGLTQWLNHNLNDFLSLTHPKRDSLTPEQEERLRQISFEAGAYGYIDHLKKVQPENYQKMIELLD